MEIKVRPGGEGEYSLVVQSDCRYYTGYKPCGKNEDCTGCPDYSPWSQRILIIKLAAIGDVVRTTAILPGLKKQDPDCRVTWLTDEAAMPLLEANPCIDLLYPFTTDGIAAIQASTYNSVLNFEKEARALGIVRTVESARVKGFVPSRSGTPVAAGNDSEYALRLGLSDDLKFRENQRTYISIIYEMAGLMYDGEEYVLELSEESERFAREFAERQGLKNGTRVVGLNTGCGTVFATKRWTVDGFVELIEDLASLKDVRLLLLGGPLEVEFNRAILERAGDRIIDTGCDNTMREFLGLIECCDVVVSSDSLAMHLAIGRKKQTVALFGPTSQTEVDLFGRGEKVSSDLECKCCYRSTCDQSPSCMEALSGATVAAAVRQCFERLQSSGN